jgi:hypothetical protein
MRYRCTGLCLVIGLFGVYGYCYFAAARQSPRPVVPADRMTETKPQTTAPRVAQPNPDGFDSSKPVLRAKEDVVKNALVLPPAPVPNPPPIADP